MNLYINYLKQPQIWKRNKACKPISFKPANPQNPQGGNFTQVHIEGAGILCTLKAALAVKVDHMILLWGKSIPSTRD